MVVLLLNAGAVQAHERSEFTSQGDLIGKVESHKVEAADTLYDIARRYKVGLVQLMAANPGVDVWVPPAGRELIIPNLHILPPGKRNGVVVNLSELRLFYFAGGDKVYSYPIGIGREGWQTPVGPTRITAKRKDPVWTPPPSIRKDDPTLPVSIPAGPDNPLGAYAMNLGWNSYTIHGTNKPDGIGRRSSHGCIRMYPEDIEELFSLVTVGTPVTVVDTSHKLGWQGEALYLEVNPTQAQSDAIMEYEHVVPLDIPSLEGEIAAAVKERALAVDQSLVRKVTEARAGIPVVIAGEEAQVRTALPQPPPLPEAETKTSAAPPVPPMTERAMMPIPLQTVPDEAPKMVETLPEEEEQPDETDAETQEVELPRDKHIFPALPERQNVGTYFDREKEKKQPKYGTKVYWQ